MRRDTCPVAGPGGGLRCCSLPWLGPCPLPVSKVIPTCAPVLASSLATSAGSVGVLGLTRPSSCLSCSCHRGWLPFQPRGSLSNPSLQPLRSVDRGLREAHCEVPARGHQGTWTPGAVASRVSSLRFLPHALACEVLRGMEKVQGEEEVSSQGLFSKFPP